MITSENTEKPKQTAQLIDNNVLIAGIKFRAETYNAFVKEIEGLDMAEDTIGLQLIKDTNNDYDPNAIKVMGYTQSKTSPESPSFHIGFLPKNIVQKIKTDGFEAYQLFAELTKWSDKAPKAFLALYKV